MGTKKYRVATLGCRTNQYESQAFSHQLRQLGYEPASEGEEADLCVVNTCTVTASADASSRRQIRQLVAENRKAKIAVTGCMAESAPEAIREIDPAIVVVGNQAKESLLEQVLGEEERFPEFQIEAFEGQTRAFVKVQDGCNSFCTYCIIPYVRGRSRSRSGSEVVEEVRRLVASGYKEVVLTGINVGDFDGGSSPMRLAELVKHVDRIEGLERLRISSIDPDEVDEELLEAVITGKRTCPSMHIVLQSGSNVVLKRMNRKYTKQMFLETVERLKGAHPDFTFTTDVIVGFPGESEADFAETVEVVEQVEFAKVHVFPYSPRNRTRAALYPNRVSEGELNRRKRHLLHVAERAAFRLRERFVGRKMGVLVEGDGWGHTAHFLPVRVGQREANQIVEVELVANTPEGLIGR
jgi:threonylcarbamoyladenosine tRNA methylthiotransferase MtaB